MIDTARYQTDPTCEGLFDITIKNLDGIGWTEAPIPRRRHKCWAQTDGWQGIDHIQRCPCGAIRVGRFAEVGWTERNSRRERPPRRRHPKPLRLSRAERFMVVAGAAFIVAYVVFVVAVMRGYIS